MDTSKEYCLNFEDEPTTWCPDVGVEAPTATDEIDVPTGTEIAAATNYSMHNK
jgi:hypothetical protein